MEQACTTKVNTPTWLVRTHLDVPVINQTIAQVLKQIKNLGTIYSQSGKIMVGADLSGIELHACYLGRYDGDGYADILLNDIAAKLTLTNRNLQTPSQDCHICLLVWCWKSENRRII